MALDRLSGTMTAGMAIRVGDDNYNEPRNGMNQPVTQTYAFGSGSGQANLVSSEEYTIGTSATTTLILDDSSLTDMFGNISDFASIKGIRVHHAGGSDASSITLAGTFSVNFTAGTDQLAITLNPGEFFVLSINKSAQAVGSGETLTLLNNDGSNAATVSVDLLGI